ncbi:amino acid ABC transporter permease [Salipiger sp. P9]|uniref:amino acid ABC transporter permease n=1 Tax=Salipiger pentaromativorans TaxID=2943193 RepID=UPI0021578C47|nr:amino acid ABC transporter permease [Salipiger pentaromativorans]MCR8547525.1 amino acid ABC transporter permease [Salipiger pentaromativorans]
MIQSRPIGSAEDGPRRASFGLVRYASALFFGSKLNTAITLISAALLWLVLPPLYDWGIGDALWSGTVEECRAASGACWAFIGEKINLIVFGMLPADDRWRAVLAIVLMVSVMALCMVPRVWSVWLVPLWIGTIGVAFWLMLGGFGLDRVRTEQVGGLPVTLLLSLTALPLGFPFGLALALGRQSEFWLFRWVSTGVIELFRGAPLVATLFIASIMMPFVLPEGMNPPKLTRALLAFTIVAAAYIAEALRGGLQSIPPGQGEAAAALGLRGWHRLWLITLPQVIRHSIPGLVNIVVSFFKDTSLIIVIGMTDFLGAIQLAARDPAWAGFNIEGYVFAALFYFSFCYVLTSYAARLERRASHY